MSSILFKQDRKLYQAIKDIQLEDLPKSDDYFNYLIRCITFQQLSGKAGATIHGRVLGLFAGKLPKPAQVLDTSHDALRSAGLSNQKAQYIRNIADFWIAEAVTQQKLDSLSDEELISYLTRIKGVGHWTAEILLMFGMGRPDLFPLDDLGIQQGMSLIYGWSGKDPKQVKALMRTVSDKWRPHRSLACRYIWAWKDRPR